MANKIVQPKVKTATGYEVLDIKNMISGSIEYTTTVPTEANTNGLKIVVLTSEPQTRYNGWIYIITEV